MATCFDRWEKDPFFPAAEEVQESTDRMESVYRRWIRETQAASIPNPGTNAGTGEVLAELLRELRTTLGTAKWQFEVLEKAVRSNDDACSAGEDTKTRHKQFFSAIGSQILKVEQSLTQDSQKDRKTKLTWVQLDDGERDELALFLSHPPLPKQAKMAPAPVGELKAGDKQLKTNGEYECRISYCNLNEMGGVGAMDEKIQAHRRTASASAGIESWKITFPEDVPRKSYHDGPILPPPKYPSFSCLTKAVDSAAKIKWPQNGFRKWKGGDQLQATETIPLTNPQFSQDNTHACFGSKGHLSCCAGDYCDKQLYDWLGAFHRQLQRSQYQIQYSRHIQIALTFVLVLLLIVLVTARAF